MSEDLLLSLMNKRKATIYTTSQVSEAIISKSPYYYYPMNETSSPFYDASGNGWPPLAGYGTYTPNSSKLKYRSPYNSPACGKRSSDNIADGGFKQDGTITGESRPFDVAAGGLPSGSTGFTWFIVARVDSISEVNGTISRNLMDSTYNAITGYSGYNITLVDSPSCLTPRALIGTFTGVQNGAKSPTQLAVGQAYWLCGRYSGTTLELLVDGVVVATNSSATNNPYGSGSSKLYVGSDPVYFNSNGIQATIGYVAFFRRVLTNTEITDIGTYLGVL